MVVDGRLLPEQGLAHFGCPQCGFVTTWPEDRDEKLMCPHNGRAVWGASSGNWVRMVPVRVTRA